MNKLIIHLTLMAASIACGQTPSPSESPAAKPSFYIGEYIACVLLFTVASAPTKVKTPVTGIVENAVYQDGKVVVPQGTVVTCVVDQPLALRDRILVEGTWHLTYPDGTDGIAFDGVVLDRESVEDANNHYFGPEDGSAGLRGSITGTERFVRVNSGKPFYIFVTRTNT